MIAPEGIYHQTLQGNNQGMENLAEGLIDKEKSVSEFPRLKIRHPEEEDEENTAETSSFRTSLHYSLRLQETRV